MLTLLIFSILAAGVKQQRNIFLTVESLILFMRKNKKLF